EGARRRKLSDRFGKVPVRLGVACDRAPKRRDHIERIEVVEPVQPRDVDMRELEAEKVPARTKDAKGLSKRRLDSRHITNAERDRARIKAFVREGQRLGVAFHKAHDLTKPALIGAPPPDLEH